VPSIRRSLPLTGLSICVLAAEHKADIFLTYCTNAMQAIREVAGARLVNVPEALAVGADYGLTTMNNASPGLYALPLLSCRLRCRAFWCAMASGLLLRTRRADAHHSFKHADRHHRLPL
jgi:hypothetical protein